METSENKFLIPLAVVVAGALVAGAVFFKSKTDVPAPAGDGTATTADITLSAVSPDDHILGNPNATVKIVEFSDIECPYCATFHATMHRIMTDYAKDGNVAWIFRNLPLDQLHPNARAKAESAECVASLGGNDAYWKYLDALFTRTDDTLETLPSIAASVGVDQTAFNTCVSEKRFASKVQAQSDEAMAAGAQAQKAGLIQGIGTPMSILILPDGTKTVLAGAQPYDVVKQVVETALKGQ